MLNYENKTQNHTVVGAWKSRDKPLKIQHFGSLHTMKMCKVYANHFFVCSFLVLCQKYKHVQNEKLTKIVCYANLLCMGKRMYVQRKRPSGQLGQTV